MKTQVDQLLTRIEAFVRQSVSHIAQQRQLEAELDELKRIYEANMEEKSKEGFEEISMETDVIDLDEPMQEGEHAREIGSTPPRLASNGNGFEKKAEGVAEHFECHGNRERSALVHSNDGKRSRPTVPQNDPNESITVNCDICQESVPISSLIEDHFRQHNRTAPYKCNICYKQFGKTKFASHLLLHENKRPYACKLCNKKYSDPAYLKRHMLFHGEQKIPCGSCEKKFPRLTELNVHMRIHSNVRPYKCNICGATYKCPAALAKHKETHNSENSPQCELCDKKFKTKYYLKIHSRIHRIQRPFECYFCKKGYFGILSLKDHMTVHTGIRPYSCDMCHKTYRTAQTLKNHKLIHDLCDNSSVKHK